MALAAKALEAKKADKPFEQGRALEQVAARIERVMGLTIKVSGPPLAGPLERRVRPNGMRQSATQWRNATKVRAAGVGRTGAGGQKGLKLSRHVQAKPSATTKPQG